MTRYCAGRDSGTVQVDGVEVNDVIECDTDLGFAILIERDAQGILILDGDQFKEKLVTGIVTFTPLIGK